jgi:hypothetical protein
MSNLILTTIIRFVFRRTVFPYVRLSEEPQPASPPVTPSPLPVITGTYVPIPEEEAHLLIFRRILGTVNNLSSVISLGDTLELPKFGRGEVVRITPWTEPGSKPGFYVLQVHYYRPDRGMAMRGFLAPCSYVEVIDHSICYVNFAKLGIFSQD